MLNELPRRLRSWFARPQMDFETMADNPSAKSADMSPVADSSDMLRRRMEALHLDSADVDRPAAQLLGIKTGLCAKCAMRGKCMKDLGDEFADPGWGDWRNYCPNATTLSILSTLGNCVEDEQQRQSEVKIDAAVQS